MGLTEVVRNPVNLLFDCAVQDRALTHVGPVLRLISRQDIYEDVLGLCICMH
jgi:hypothetical protein